MPDQNKEKIETITRADLALLILKKEVEIDSELDEDVEWWMFQGTLFHWVEEKNESGAMWHEVRIVE